MDRDIRATSSFRQAESLFNDFLQPGTGRICDAAEISASPDNQHAVYAGTLMHKLEGKPPTRICRTNLVTGETQVITFGPNTDRLPKYSPCGRYVAFLSDRQRSGDFQLFLLHLDNGVAEPIARVDGWVENFHWSPNGGRILLCVAGHGADTAGAQGAVISAQIEKKLPSWLPAVATGSERHRWRQAWVYDLATDEAIRVSAANQNIWEAVWCGDDTIAAVVSAGPGEGLWYGARLIAIQVADGSSHTLHAPEHQLGWPAASPSGERLAIVEAISSDRGFVAGDLLIVDVAHKQIRGVCTGNVDIAFTEWRSDHCLLLAGHRDLDLVVGLYDVSSESFTELWCGREISAGSQSIWVSGLNDNGDCVLIGESFTRAPEIAMIQQGKYRTVKSLDLGHGEEVASAVSVNRVSWQAPDGLQIRGYLLRPKGHGRHPLVMNVHGGPVWHWRPIWLGRIGRLPLLLLLHAGYAIFLPNPRGSSGRGQDFARLVLGHVGEADADDCLSGIDYLVKEGIADPTRLGVMGISYGGFMTAWLITQDSRFAAAVAVAPHTNHVTAHLLSNISTFVSMFVGDKYTNPNGKYFERSPIMHAHDAKTPTLNICGALDRSAPPAEAMQFHNALLENSVKSVLVTYPEEGHGIRSLPTVIDFAVRLVHWFQEHMPAARTLT